MSVCAMGRHCMGALPWHQEAQVCESCLGGYARSVRALALDYEDLAHELTASQQRSDEDTRPANKPSSRPPLVAYVSHLRDEIRWQLGTWEVPVRVWLGAPLPARRAVRPQWVVETAAGFLAANMKTFAEVPLISGPFDGGDKATVARNGRQGMVSLSRLHDRVRRVVGQSDLVIHLPGDCPVCHAWALRREAGTDDVWCVMCQRTWPYASYQAWVSARLYGGSVLDPA